MDEYQELKKELNSKVANIRSKAILGCKMSEEEVEFFIEQSFDKIEDEYNSNGELISLMFLGDSVFGVKGNHSQVATEYEEVSDVKYYPKDVDKYMKNN